MTDNEQNAYADMLAMLITIQDLMGGNEMINKCNLFEQVTEVIVAAQAAQADEDS